MGKRCYVFALLFVWFVCACSGQSSVSNSSDPTDPTNPTDPTDPTDPTNPTDSTDSTDSADPADPADPAASADPANLVRYTVDGGRILFNGTEIYLFGINWSGAQDGNLVVDGLWERGYADIISDVKALGLNAIRLPFCPDTLGAGDIGYIDEDENPDLVGLNSLEALDVIVNAINDQQMFILLDHHNIECGTISELWYTDDYSEQDWIDDLVSVATRYESLEYFVGLDLKNEPHDPATWGNDNPSTDWNHAAERAAEAILAVNDQILIFVAGIQDPSTEDCFSDEYHHSWGENLQPYACYPLDISSDKFVLSPHAYHRSWFEDDLADPEDAFAVWDEHFGFLIDEGPAVVPGEFGGLYTDESDPDSDKVWIDTFVDYLIQKNMCSFFYWALNANVDGGIFADDWVTVETETVENLRRLMGVCAK